MNRKNFEHWVLTQVLPNLEKPSLVMDIVVIPQCHGETSNTEQEKGQDNCLAATEEN
jgi:prophage antirepressor-like protein